jgi:positive regulator of sigma E activity
VREMTTLKEDAKDVGLSLVFDFMLVAIILCWILAIVLALLEVTLWVVFGVFLLGCGFFFLVMYFSKKSEEKEKSKEKAVEKEESEIFD